MRLESTQLLQSVHQEHSTIPDEGFHLIIPLLLVGSFLM